MGTQRPPMNFMALSMGLFGGMHSIWTMPLIFYRCTFFALKPEDLTPPYWINMGAMAISTLAGSHLVMNAADAPFLHTLCLAWTLVMAGLVARSVRQLTR